MCFSGPSHSFSDFSRSSAVRASLDISQPPKGDERWSCRRRASEPIPSVVRFLLVNNHCISDPTAGVTQSLRTIVEWLADAGHACHVLTTARFEAKVGFTIENHLEERGVAMPRPAKKSRRARPVVHYQVRDVPVTLLL